MKITIEEARKIALLSRLEFSAEDLEKMRESMNSILTHMEELNQHDTYGVYMSAMPNSIIIIHFIKCIAEFSHFYPIFKKMK